MDLDTLKPGSDFAQDIDQAVSQCEVMVSLVGNRWLMLPDESGASRINNPEDWVRLEIKSALDRNIPVVPLLVQRASMPSQLQLPPELAQFTRRQAFELLDNRFHQDADNLINRLEEILDEVAERKKLEEEAKQKEVERLHNEEQARRNEETQKRHGPELKPNDIMFKYLLPIYEKLSPISSLLLLLFSLGVPTILFFVLPNLMFIPLRPMQIGINIMLEILFLGLWVYVHLRLNAIWKQIGNLQLVFSDWKFFEGNANSSFLIDLLWPHLPFPTDYPGPFRLGKVNLLSFFLWLMVPLLFFFSWSITLIARSWLFTALHILLFGVSAWISLILYGRVKSKFPYSGLPKSSFEELLRSGIKYKHYVVLGYTGIMIVMSMVAFQFPIYGTKNLKDVRSYEITLIGKGKNLKEAKRRRAWQGPTLPWPGC